jgi:hypothetical protein
MSLLQSRERPRFHLLPRHDVIRRCVVFCQSALQFLALSFRQQRRLRFGDDRVPDRLNQG